MPKYPIPVSPRINRVVLAVLIAAGRELFANRHDPDPKRRGVTRLSLAMAINRARDVKKRLAAVGNN